MFTPTSPLIVSALTVLTAASIHATTVSIDFESSNPLTGGTGTSIGPNGTTSLNIGGQNNQAAVGDFSNSFNYSSSETGVQQYAVRFEIAIQSTGTGSARGFQITEQGNLQNGTGPNLQFIEGHEGGDFVFATGIGGSILDTDVNGNSWSFANGEEPQASEIFSIDFLVEFSFPGSGDINNRGFDYSATITRSDPNNLIAVDTLTFSASKIVNGTNFVDRLGDITFRESGVGGFEGAIDNIVISDTAFVPEPSSLFLLALSSGGFLLRRKRTT